VELKKNRAEVPENMNTIVVGAETRWTAHDAKFFKMKMSGNLAMTVHHRFGIRRECRYLRSSH
jgi:hypothetical protein